MNSIARRHRRGRGDYRPAGRLVENPRGSRRSLHARGLERSLVEEGGPRGLRSLAGEAQEGRLPVTALDEAIMEENGEGGARPTQADILIDLASAAELFHAADGTALRRSRHQRPPRNLARSHQGVQAVAGAAVLRGDGGAPSSEALQSALNVIEARAISTRRNVPCSFASADWTAAVSRPR